ncbi:DUF63 family protein [Halococcus salifodinae]|uniref:DUF63 domain-containing protein n=1 Tax=Halococcus salifodinae DSM 8989 TaxID=1227456 RepID=M0NCL0_9EURY|nr:DUF63 family protein [Halococcus salifodinae]EMA55566.1 hypothetical protein C450_02329 [Halococcus salifodinae DSM 8989]
MVPVQVLPEGTTLPSPVVLLVLAIGIAGVVVALRRIAPRVTERVVVAFAPWMVAGSSCYVLYQVEAVPESVAPFFSSPAVYVSIAVLAGAVWAATAATGLSADRWRLPSVPGIVALVGSAVAIAAVGWAFAFGVETRRGLTVAWPAVGLIVAVVLAAVVWSGLQRVAPETRITGGVGALAVFGHTLDGVSTAVGIDVLGFGEQSPISRAIITFAADLPTAPVLGTVWLFILVKLVLAAVVVVLFSGYVRDEPAEGYLLLGAVAAVGLGPGVHNLLLFTIATP